ncbi:LEC14B protein-like isoform X1 [Apium graveolens]|uniref:LEC14B protein-like isoform X1 n=1 Tax=Apium graveolens TaxID=4045 RepID=UPI003D7C0DE5
MYEEFQNDKQRRKILNLLKYETVFSNDVLMGEHSASSTELHEILKFRVLDDNDDYGILSVKFSSDSKEIIAGTSDSSICVYDLGINRLSLRFKPHMLFSYTPIKFKIASWDP